MAQIALEKILKAHLDTFVAAIQPAQAEAKQKMQRRDFIADNVTTGSDFCGMENERAITRSQVSDDIVFLDLRQFDQPVDIFVFGRHWRSGAEGRVDHGEEDDEGEDEEDEIEKQNLNPND